MTNTSSIPRYPDLAGKVAVVTGGSRGIGAATCRAMSGNGAKVAVNGRSTASVEEVVAQARDAGGEAVPAVADCTDAAALAAMGERVEETLGVPELLLAFAGGGRPARPLADISAEEWRADLEQNLTATFLTLQAFLPAMLARGRGAIVTMASAAARVAGGAPLGYAAAKAGVVSLTQQLAHQVGPDGVRVNCLAPSTVLVERTREQMPEQVQQKLAGMYPLRRLGEPDDVANAALYLASDASSWLTGVTLDVAGGRAMV